MNENLNVIEVLLVDPVDFDRFIEVVRQIDDFFVSVVRLPIRR